MRFHTAIPSVMLRMITWRGLHMGTQSHDDNSYTLFGCLYVYGFFLDLPNRLNVTSEASPFMHEHFCRLGAERQDGSAVNLKTTSFDDGGIPVCNPKIYSAEDLGVTALMMAMRMELQMTKCIGMLPHILRDSNFEDPKLLLMAANRLQMEWVSKEILKTVEIEDENANLYMLLRKYFTESIKETGNRIAQIIRTREYKEIHGDFRNFCLNAKNTGTEHEIAIVQLRFGILNAHNFAYFVNNELLFVLEIFATGKYLHTIFPATLLDDEQVRFILRDGTPSMLHNIQASAARKSLLEMVRAGECQMKLIPAIYMLLTEIGSSKRKRDEISRVLHPEVLLLTRLIETNNLQGLGTFLDHHPEYVNEALIVWATKMNMDMIVWIFVNKIDIRKMVLLGERESTFVLGSPLSINLPRLLNCGMVFTLARTNISALISPVRIQEMTLSPHHIFRYDISLINYICECKRWRFLDQLLQSIRSTDVVEEYVQMIAQKTDPRA